MSRTASSSRRPALAACALFVLATLPFAAPAQQVADASPPLAPAVQAAPEAPIGFLVEAEPNGKTRQAQTIELGRLGAVITGTVKRPGDVDNYRLKLAIGSCVANVLTPNPLSDFDLELVSSLGIVLARSQNRGPGQIEVLPICGLPLSTTYYLRVVHAGGATGPLLGAYSIEIAR